MFSQNNEEKIIADFFGDRFGRFLDIGAYDGLKYSNTRRLLDCGWSGVMIEPSPSVLPLLRGNVAQYGTRATVCACAVGDRDGEIDFFDNAGAVATTSIDHVKKWSAQTKFDACRVNSITPNRIVELFGSNFDFVNIDTEGTNLSIVQLMPWHMMLPTLSLVCVEHDSHQFEIRDVLEDYGFERICENGENLIMAR